MMKKLIAAFCIFLSFTAFAEFYFEKEASGTPELIQKGPQKEWCPVCGMNLTNFYKTSHAVILKNGTKKQYCSIRCLAYDWPNIEGQIKAILVVDAKTEKLINARKAVYLIGSKAEGTMTKISKIAFASEKDAKEFQKELGGNLGTFADAFKLAKNSLKSDSAMSAAKKEKMMYPMGEKVYKTKCAPVNSENFEQINALKAYIQDNGICGKINESQLQAVALYLWEVASNNGINAYISVPEDARCPVCAMFVAKYPKWAAQMDFTQNGAKHTVYFDGVKDMMKFYFKPAKWGKYYDIKPVQMLVSDYYSRKVVNAKDAFYVTGSDVLGPMGEELIPFFSEENAKTFMKDHNGRKLLRFDEITGKTLRK